MPRIITLLALVVVTFGWLYFAWQDTRLAIGVGLTVLGLMGLGALMVLWLVFGSEVWIGEEDTDG